MAWNGSGGGSAEPQAPRNGSPAPVWLKGALAGVVVVVLGVAVLYFMKLEEKKPTTQEVETKRPVVEEVKPSVPSKSETAAEAPKPRKKRYWEVDASETNGFTAAQMRKWTFEHTPPPTWTNTALAAYAKPRYSIFPTKIENDIACLLMSEPGSSLVGMPVYPRNANDQFIKSCETPIIVGADDDEYAANLKREMIAAKIELRNRIAAGENIGDILHESRAEMRRLAQVKRDLENEVRGLIKTDAATVEDVDAYVEAANKMLETKGVAPLKLSDISRRAISISLKTKQRNGKGN